MQRKISPARRDFSAHVIVNGLYRRMSASVIGGRR